MTHRPRGSRLATIFKRTSAEVEGGPEASRRALAAHMVTIADTLAHAVGHAAMLNVAIPPPIGNAIHDLRGWAARLHHPGSARSAGANAARMIAYIRSLPDHQLLALLADLPWARLDALLDATAEPNPEPIDLTAAPHNEHDPTEQPRNARRR
jgi:hypothetical protein